MIPYQTSAVGNSLLKKETMSDIKTTDDQTPEPDPDAQSITHMLKKPLTLSAPTWAFLLAGVVALGLIVIALD